jgi:hypothetical protein
MTAKNLYLKTGKFLKDESNKIMRKLIHSKDKKTLNQARKELAAIRRRIAIEIELLEKFSEEND